MLKSELLTGDLVVTADEYEYFVIENTVTGDILVNKDLSATGWDRLDAYNEDLTSKELEAFNIDKVYRYKGKSYGNIIKKPEDYSLIWERADMDMDRTPQPMTIEEIQERLGYPIVIVSSK